MTTDPPPSDTPRTDAEKYSTVSLFYEGEHVSADFARTLERQLNAALAGHKLAFDALTKANEEHAESARRHDARCSEFERMAVEARARVAELENEVADSNILLGGEWRQSVKAVNGDPVAAREHRIAALVGDAAELRADLLASQARELALREALDSIRNSACPIRDPLNVCGGDVVASDRRLDSIRKRAVAALTQPAPPVVPAAEVERLREALEKAVESGCGTTYNSEHDEIGRHGCCDELSYKAHARDCWTTKARAALAGKEGGK